jgi:hypothetical protein
MAYRASRTEIIVAFTEYITVSESRSCYVNRRDTLGIPSMATDFLIVRRVQYILDASSRAAQRKESNGHIT